MPSATTTGGGSSPRRSASIRTPRIRCSSSSSRHRLGGVHGRARSHRAEIGGAGLDGHRHLDDADRLGLRHAAGRPQGPEREDSAGDGGIPGGRGSAPPASLVHAHAPEQARAGARTARWRRRPRGHHAAGAERCVGGAGALRRRGRGDAGALSREGRAPGKGAGAGNGGGADPDRHAVVPGPVDLLAWTPTIDRFVRRPDLKATKKVLWLSGQATPRARRELERRGWTVEAPAPGEASAPVGS